MTGAGVKVCCMCESVSVCLCFEPVCVCACMCNNKALHVGRSMKYSSLRSEVQSVPQTRVTDRQQQTELQTVRPTDGQTDRRVDGKVRTTESKNDR